ncbi:MAG: hypothetical protein AAF074_18820 [Pseudomonadota bacterium]
MGLLSRVFGRGAPQRGGGEAVPSPTELLYVVGATEGRADLLEPLLARIADDAATRDRPGQPAPRVVALGSHTGRGGQGLAALDMLMAAEARFGLAVEALLGPQEARLLELLGGGTDGREWLLSGGIATLQECGIDARALACSPDPGPWLATALREAFGARLGAIAGMAPSVRCGNLLLCSGGGEAGMRVEAQTRNALIFGPETDEAEILREDGLVVVHARPTGDGPGCGPQHIALDTGAAFSHQLAAARIATDGAVVFLDVDRASQD